MNSFLEETIMKRNHRSIVALAFFGFVVVGFMGTTGAAPAQKPSGDAQLNETLKEVNRGFKNVKVQLVHWPDELHKKLGKLKKTAFMAVPMKKSAGKMPLLIALHGGGGKTQSVEKQLARSAVVKGLALAELAGENMILLEPNSSDSWDPDTLDIMLDYVLDHYPQIDKNRVYVMGHSMGGGGTWNWILQSGGRFAAAAPCGFGGGESGDEIEKLVKLPIWGMVGGDDGNNVAGVQKMVDQLRAAGNVNVRHTAFPGANHSAGNAAVFSSVEWVDWMLTFSRSK